MFWNPRTLIISLYISARCLFTRLHYEQDILSFYESMRCFILCISLIIMLSKIKKHSYFSALTRNEENEKVSIRNFVGKMGKIFHSQDYRRINFEVGNFLLILLKSCPLRLYSSLILRVTYFFSITYKISN